MTLPRGQGAMEYLMTYGWAVLVVMIVGGAIWKMGILNIGGSIPTTASGFEALKPLIPTCKISDDAIPYMAFTKYPGLSCDFVNGAGQNIMVTGADMKLNGKICYWAFVGNNLHDTHYIGTGWADCPAYGEFDISCRQDSCSFAGGCWNCCYYDGSGQNVVPVQAGSTFTVAIVNDGAVSGCWGGGSDCPCGSLKTGDVYTATVDITYEAAIGGQNVVKHSAGTIRGTVE